MNYGQLFEELYNRKVKYLLCGGLATNLYGLQRMTADIDLIIDLEENNLKAFKLVMENLNYKASIPVDIVELANSEKLQYYKTQKNLIAYSYFNLKKEFVQVDVITEFPYHFNEMWGRKKVDTAMGFELNVIELNDLIEMKTQAGRDQDLTDVEYLKRLKNE